MKTGYKKIALGIMVGVMSLSAAACGTDKTAQTGKTSENVQSSEEELVTVNVAYMPDYGSLSGIIAADALGYFEEEGIKLNLVQFTEGPTIINAMESGSIDVGYIGQGAHKLCINGKADIFAMAHLDYGDAVIGNKEKGTDSLEDLKGKKVAYSSGTSSEDILVKGLEKVGLTMEDITPVDMDASSLVTAMLSGSVDAASAWAPNTTQILKELGDNGVTLCDNKTFLADTVSLASWVCMPDYAKENRDLLVRFTRALYKGNDYRADHSHDDEVCGWISEKVKLEKETLLKQVETAEWTTSSFVRDETETLKSYYQIQQDTFVEKGDCEKTPLEDYLLLDIMTEACK